MSGRDKGVPGVVIALTDDRGDVVATTTTDENGEYRFRGIGGGTYTVTAHPRQEDPVAHGVTVSGGTASTHDFVLGGGGELAGSVRRTGTPRKNMRRNNVRESVQRSAA